MVYYGRKRRGRARARRSYRKRRGSGWMGNAGKALALAGTALSVARGVKSMLNVEYKHHSRNLAGTAIGATISYGCLTLIEQGDDWSQRNGRQVKATNLSIKGEIARGAGAGPQKIRLIVFQDMNGDGVAPGSTDVVEASTIMAWRNLNETDRFKILWDKVFTVHEDKPAITFKLNRKMDDRIEYLTTGNTVASCGQAHIWWGYFTDTAVAGPVLAMASRTRYVDN